MPNPEELAAHPDYCLNEVDLDRLEYGFLKLDSGAYRRSAFMDQRIHSEKRESVRVPLGVMDKLVADIQATGKPIPINYIFHTAFCCSTLISRCLDIEGVCCALREPSVLMQMANYKRSGNHHMPDSNRWRVTLNTVLFLLAKTAIGNEAVLIKPTNAANNLSGEIIRDPRTHGVLLLYSSLEQFLISIIKKGEEGRAFVRKLFNVIMTDSQRTQALSPRSLAQLTDLQVAAFVWYLQMDNYLELIGGFPGARVRTLDCDAFLKEPAGMLEKLCALFGITVKAGILEEIVAGPVFRKYSKNNAHDYDSAVREAEYGKIAREYKVTLSGILAWSEHIRPQGPVRLPLSQAL